MQSLSVLLLLLIVFAREFKALFAAARALDNWLFDRTRDDRYVLVYQSVVVFYGWLLVLTSMQRKLELPPEAAADYSVFSPALVLFLLYEGSFC